MTFTKIDIVEAVQEKINITKNQSADIVGSLLGIMKNTLASGEDVLVSGFGKFCVKEKS